MSVARKLIATLLNELAALLFIIAVALYFFADWFAKPTKTEAEK